MTKPSSSPSAPRTGASIRSLRRMTTPGYSSDDPGLNPLLKGSYAKLGLRSRDLHYVSDLGDLPVVDAQRLGGVLLGQSGSDRDHPAAEPSAEPWSQCSWPDKDRSDE